MRNELREMINAVMAVIKPEIEEEFNRRDWSKANVDTGNIINYNKDTVSAASVLMIAKGEASERVSNLVYRGVYDTTVLLAEARRSYRDTLNYYNYRWMIAKRAIAFYKKHEEVFKDSSNVTIDDLIEEGMSKLVEVANKFDESKGYKFNTFLMTCIDNEFMEYSVRHSRFIRLTKKQNRDIAAICKRYTELQDDEGLTADEAMNKLCAEFDKPEYEIERMMSINRLPASFDFGYDTVDGSELYLAYTMPEDYEGPIEKRVVKALNEVKDTPKTMVDLYLRATGFYGKPELKKDLCNEFGFKNRNELNNALEDTRLSLAKELRPQFCDYFA
ncbi:MAG: sigma factor [Erysipelotrichaceae bacterium]|nr:sigma factor [Erysipelotrichaceae bacterium]